MAGPTAWPTAYEDIIGFSLWPKDYTERLRSHGIGEVLATALSPSATLAAKTRQARADEPGQPSPAAVSTCGVTDSTSFDWPTAELKNSLNLDAAQTVKLDQLKATLGDALRTVKASCRDTAKLSPVERLSATQQMLWAVHDAAQLLREPLARFYDSLSDEQKRKFAAPAMSETNTPPSRAAMARMCDLPGSPDAVRRIEQSIHPTKPQKASLDALQKKSFEMGQFLIASCLKPPPATPVERLDAATDRLTAVIFAASNVNVALNDFTSQLTDEQKAKLSSAAW